MNLSPFSFVRQSIECVCLAAKQRLRRWTAPDNHRLVLNAAMDLTRSKPEPLQENMLLRQQLIVLKRQMKQPALTWRDRTLLVLLASRLRTCKQALVIVQPDTVLRWHRELSRWVCRRKSGPKRRRGKPPPNDEIVALIKQMAKENRTWGAERIRGELLKLGLPKQTWATFLRSHAKEIWACDFLQTYDLFFRAVFVLVITELGSRRVVHFGVTGNPTDAWLAQQLREATPFGEGARSLIRDNDRKDGRLLARVASGTGIDVLKTPYGAPKANAICERFLGSVRRECLDYFLVVSERHLCRLMKEYRGYLNHARPHQGIEQRIPCQPVRGAEPQTIGELISCPVFGGLHHDYHWQSHARPSYPRAASRMRVFGQDSLLGSYCSMGTVGPPLLRPASPERTREVRRLAQE